MGTHNALLRIGPRVYLEIIASIPRRKRAARPRWFDLDEPRMSAALAEGPHLIHWAVRTATSTSDVREVPTTWATVTPMARGDLQWRITVPEDGHRPGRGLRADADRMVGRAPPDRAADGFGHAAVTIAGEHPEPAPVREALAAARTFRHAQSHLRPHAAARGDDAHAARRGDDLGRGSGARRANQPSAPRASTGHTPSTTPSRTATIQS